MTSAAEVTAGPHTLPNAISLTSRPYPPLSYAGSTNLVRVIDLGSNSVKGLSR